jgi:hypothetical protein
MKKPPKMEISHPTASHLPALEQALAAVKDGASVIEHGAGLYSTPTFERSQARVTCVESHEGWADWARWMYRDHYGSEVVASPPVSRVKDAALVFIDGPAEERGPLLSACIEAGVPIIIAHDTGIKTRDYYGYKPSHFMVTRYEVTHPVDRTTVWRLKPPMGVPFDV